MNNNIQPAFQSSIDPTKLSLSIESGSKALIAFGTYIFMIKGIDATPFANQIEAITAAAITVISGSVGVWHGMQTLYGLVRKLFVKTTAQNTKVVI